MNSGLGAHHTLHRPKISNFKSFGVFIQERDIQCSAYAPRSYMLGNAPWFMHERQGSRGVCVVTGHLARTSIERLDQLNDKCHIIRVSIVGGVHYMAHSQSTIILYEPEGPQLRLNRKLWMFRIKGINHDYFVQFMTCLCRCCKIQFLTHKGGKCFIF